MKYQRNRKQKFSEKDKIERKIEQRRKKSRKVRAKKETSNSGYVF